MQHHAHRGQAQGLDRLFQHHLLAVAGIVLFGLIESGLRLVHRARGLAEVIWRGPR